MTYRRLAVLLMVAGCIFAHVRVGCASTAEDVRAIYDAAVIKGGFVVDLGCGTGQLTAALRMSDNIVVQGLDASPANVEKARAAIQSSGLYGPVSVNLFDGKRLPYVDDLANLIVVEDPGHVPMAEIMRVLAPLGVACVKQGGAWTKTVKHGPPTSTSGRSIFTAATTTPWPMIASSAPRVITNGRRRPSGAAPTWCCRQSRA
jgi:SAM-dependent methyltransferase